MPPPIVLAVEGGSFSKEAGKRAIMALLLTEGIVLKRLHFTSVEVDGLDATDRLLEGMVSLGSRPDLVLSDSIPIAGFNMINAEEIEIEAGIPTVFVLPNIPDERGVANALRKHFPVVSSKLIGILTATIIPSTLRRAENTQAIPPRPT